MACCLASMIAPGWGWYLGPRGPSRVMMGHFPFSISVDKLKNALTAPLDEEPRTALTPKCLAKAVTYSPSLELLMRTVHFFLSGLFVIAGRKSILLCHTAKTAGAPDKLLRDDFPVMRLRNVAVYKRVNMPRSHIMIPGMLFLFLNVNMRFLLTFPFLHILPLEHHFLQEKVLLPEGRRPQGSCLYDSGELLHFHFQCILHLQFADRALKMTSVHQ